MTGLTDPKTTIVDALLVGNSSFGPVAGQTIMEAHSVGVTISPLQNRHFTVRTDTAGNIILDTDDSGNARGDISHLAGTNIVEQYGLNPLTPGTSSWKLFNAELSKYMLEANGDGTLELKEHIDYVEDGDELWTLLADATERVIYLKGGVTYDLTPGTGTRTITLARKTVIGASSPRSDTMPIIRLTVNDYLLIEEQCLFENIHFTEDWDGPTFPGYLVNCKNDGASSTFRGCKFSVTNSPTLCILLFNTPGRSHILENCHFSAIPVTAGLAGLQSYGAENSVVRDCTFEGGEKAIYFTGGLWKNALVEHNQFINDAALAAKVRLHIEADGDNFIIRNNIFIKTSSDAPAPAIHCDGSGTFLIEGNHIETKHTDSVTWGAVYLVQVDNGNVDFINNTVKSQEMTVAESGMVGVGPGVDSFRCEGNQFIGGTDQKWGVVIDTLGTEEKPDGLQINSNHFSDIEVSNGACIYFMDSTAGANNWPVLGTISNNIFKTPEGTTVYAVNGVPPSGQEMRGFSVMGNVISGDGYIDQDLFELCTIKNNINITSGSYPVSPDIPARSNKVEDNIPSIPV